MTFVKPRLKRKNDCLPCHNIQTSSRWASLSSNWQSPIINNMLLLKIYLEFPFCNKMLKHIHVHTNAHNHIYLQIYTHFKYILCLYKRLLFFNFIWNKSFIIINFDGRPTVVMRGRLSGTLNVIKLNVRKKKLFRILEFSGEWDQRTLRDCDLRKYNFWNWNI